MLIGLDIRNRDTVTPESIGRARKTRKRPAGDARPVILKFETPHQGAGESRVKRGLDVVLCLLMLVPALPVILLAALVVRLTSRGPAVYTQTRVGRDGRLFTIYKIRTMVDNCESLTGPRWSIPGDPRITCVGQFLRDSHIDELPQLLNVLRGDMSLIGPRPERPEFVRELERAVPDYRGRLAIRPGVTGLAQLQLPPDSGLDSVRAKLAHDLHYIRTRTLWLDCRILIGTACRVAGISFARYGRWLRLPMDAMIRASLPPATEEVISLRVARAA